MDVTLLLAAHAAVLGLMTTYCIEDYKLFVAAIKTKDWQPFINKTACLPVAFILLSLSPVNLPIFAGIAGKVIASICISALAADYIYPITKRLKPSAPCDTTPVGTFEPEIVAEQRERPELQDVLKQVVNEYKESTEPEKALTEYLTGRLSGKL